MQHLLGRLRQIETRQEELGQEHAAVMRAIVHKAGGVHQAAALLDLDPKTVRARERAADIALVLYRGSNTRKAAFGAGELEAAQDTQEQRDADRRWFTIAKDKRPILRGVIYVCGGQVTRVREVTAGDWEEGPDGKVAIPVGPPLSAAEVGRRFPALPFTVGSPRPMIRGKIREYLALAPALGVTA
ncbi:hypothetical protein [Streptomyces lavendofoliae]|uniref:hypothetical protein n=1 Tax=Streptomyces lavendofoliae TaxID=67314 RepID=UPI003D93BF80